MDDTESERALPRVPNIAPIFHLLFSGGQILLEPPALALPPGQTKIGRDIDAKAGIKLPLSRRASREHAGCEVRMRKEELDVRIHDFESKNGTFVNGERIQTAKISDGDLVRIGDSLLLLRFCAAAQKDAPISAISGNSTAIRALRKRLAELAAAPVPVLLIGESGTGKELAAQALHELSGRQGRFIPVNCSAIPESLAESQLFGHVPGSFTGALGNEGFFRAAQNGTLFLDEIGEMPLGLQPKLLRALENYVIAPVGSTRATKIDVRVIAATNRDLYAEVAAGRFRADLYARLCALLIKTPPLRERREDVLLLLANALGAGHLPLSATLAEALVLYSWPLNVRELVQIALHLKYSAEDCTELTLPLVADRLNGPTLTSSNDKLELEPITPIEKEDELPPKPLPREEVLRLLEEHHGILTRVAAAAGRSPRQIRRWMDLYQIEFKRSGK